MWKGWIHTLPTRLPTPGLKCTKSALWLVANSLGSRNPAVGLSKLSRANLPHFPIVRVSAYDENKAYIYEILSASNLNGCCKHPNAELRTNTSSEIPFRLVSSAPPLLVLLTPLSEDLLCSPSFPKCWGLNPRFFTCKIGLPPLRLWMKEDAGRLTLDSRERSEPGLQTDPENKQRDSTRYGIPKESSGLLAGY